MKALIFNKKLKFTDVVIPKKGKDDVLVRVTKAGICKTDHEIVKGYVKGFRGILGHEFIGIVEDSNDKSLIGKRVTSEINFSCNRCEYCLKGLQRHCPNRTVLGIQNKDGAFAEYVIVPKENIFILAQNISDNTAIFIEPLAAALEILDQVLLNGKNILIIGDGKLGLLIAYAINKAVKCNLLIIGKHIEKLNIVKKIGIKTSLLHNFKAAHQYDIVIEASGNPDALYLALQSVKPRGTIVLKSTYASIPKVNVSDIVVNEVCVVGSRCGRFSEAIKFIKKFKPDFSLFISKEFPFEKAIEAFEYSKKHNVIKVLLKMDKNNW